MHILQIPVDIWFYLLLSVPTRLKLDDVIALGQTCTQLHAVFSGRSLWWSLLKTVCAKDDIYLPSFDKDEMAEREIKRAALASSRMADLINTLQFKERDSRNADPSIVTRNKLTPISKYVLPYTPRQNILAMVLLPGGRFLFTKTKDEVLVIDVQRKDPPLPQMRHKSTGDPRFANWIFLLGPSLDGSRYRIASIDQHSARYASSSLLGQQTLFVGLPLLRRLDATIIILEFDPHAACLTQIASRAVSQDRPMTQTVLHGDTLSGNLYAFFDPNSATISTWDFVRDVYVYWKVGHVLSHEAIFKKLMIDYPRKIIILITDLNVLIWDLDPILANSKPGKLEGFLPLWALPFAIRLSQHPYQPISRWMRPRATFISINISYYTHCPIPGFDVLIYDDISKGGKIYSYEFFLQDNLQASCSAAAGQSNDLRPRASLCQAHDIPDYPTRDTGIKHNRFCDGQQVVFWENYRAGLFTFIKASSLDENFGDDIIPSDAGPSPIPDSTTGETFPSIRKNLVGVEMVRYSSVNPDVEYPAWEPHETAASRVEPIFGGSTFDPASGRMCSSSLDGRSIIMHDYLGEFGTGAHDSLYQITCASGTDPQPAAPNGRKGAVREAGRTVRKAFHSARNLVVGQPR